MPAAWSCTLTYTMRMRISRSFLLTFLMMVRSPMVMAYKSRSLVDTRHKGIDCLEFQEAAQSQHRARGIPVCNIPKISPLRARG
eukprot:1161329-Pelagomonas_calceolata.AAC.4